jgi:hypothetical protein
MVEITNKNLTEDRFNMQIKAMEMCGEYQDLLKRCEKRGTCDVLAAHHQMLGDDPERLSTQFLVKLICKKDYEPGSKSREVMDYQRLEMVDPRKRGF